MRLSLRYFIQKGVRTKKYFLKMDVNEEDLAKWGGGRSSLGGGGGGGSSLGGDGGNPSVQAGTGVIFEETGSEVKDSGIKDVFDELPE